MKIFFGKIFEIFSSEKKQDTPVHKRPKSPESPSPSRVRAPSPHFSSPSNGPGSVSPKPTLGQG